MLQSNQVCLVPEIKLFNRSLVISELHKLTWILTHSSISTLPPQTSLFPNRALIVLVRASTFFLQQPKE